MRYRNPAYLPTVQNPAQQMVDLGAETLLGAVRPGGFATMARGKNPGDEDKTCPDGMGAAQGWQARPLFGAWAMHASGEASAMLLHRCALVAANLGNPLWLRRCCSRIASSVCDRDEAKIRSWCTVVEVVILVCSTKVISVPDC